MSTPNSPEVCHQICEGCEVGALQARLIDDANQRTLDHRKLVSDTISLTEQQIAQRAAELSENSTVLRNMLEGQLAAMSSAQQENLQALRSEVPLREVVCKGKKGLLKHCGVTVVSAE